MKKKTVFLLQGNKEINEELKEKFDATEEYEVVGTSVDAISAISMIADKKPNFLITELVLSGYDGLSVIEKVSALKLSVKIIVLSAMRNEDAVSNSVAAGAQYFMAKPYNFSLLLDRMKDLSERLEPAPKGTNEGLHKVS